MPNKDLRYIIDHWCQFEKWVKESYQNTITLNSSINNTIASINFNTGSNQLEFSHVDINGDIITNNVDLSTLSSSQFQIENIVDQFSDLSSISNPTLFEFARVRFEEGTKWLSNYLGVGDYHGSGLYMWDGSDWVNDDEEIYNELNNILIRLNTLVDSVTSGTGISIDNTDPNNPIISIDTAILNVINTALQPGDNISELVNDSGYLTSFNETDPVFLASEAANFVTGDKANLDNQSGTNTGDQDADTVAFTPTGNTSSNNVQDAIEELQTELDGLSLDHGNLTGLNDDDHPQYLNVSRGDARYYTETEVDSIVQSLTKEYFQATPLTNINNILNTDVILSFTENQNSNNSVFNFVSDELTVNKNSVFKFEIPISGDTNTGARENLISRLQRNRSGAGFQDIPVSEGASFCYSYHRNNLAGKDTGKINITLTVLSGDIFRVVSFSPTQGVNILANGTNLTVEEK